MMIHGCREIREIYKHSTAYWEEGVKEIELFKDEALIKNDIGQRIDQTMTLVRMECYSEDRGQDLLRNIEIIPILGEKPYGPLSAWIYRNDEQLGRPIVIPVRQLVKITARWIGKLHHGSFLFRVGFSGLLTRDVA